MDSHISWAVCLRTVQIKQIVDHIYTKRKQFMPADETVEQHEARRLEEIAAVEKDRSEDNLFKGTFPARGNDLWQDEEDGVMRCPACGHEYVGGPNCAHCNYEINDDSDYGNGFSDVDEDDLEIDLNDLEEDHFGPPMDGYGYGSASDMISDGSSEEGSDGSEHGSNHNEQHEQPVRNSIIEISDNESDEGGAPSRRRLHRRGIVGNRSSSVLNDSTDASESGDHNDDVNLRQAGWSPLNQEDESDNDDVARFADQSDFGNPENEFGTELESDTETMIGHQASDDDGQSSSSRSETPRFYDAEPRSNNSDDGDDNRSERASSSITDRDGDTDMSASPSASRSSRSVSADTDGYRYGPGYDDVAADLGYANHVHDVEDYPSSDNTEVEYRRRQARRLQGIPGYTSPIYDPHQSTFGFRHMRPSFTTASTDFNILTNDILGHRARRSVTPSASRSRSRPHPRLHNSDNDIYRIEPASSGLQRRPTYRSYRSRSYNDRREIAPSPSMNPVATGVYRIPVGRAAHDERSGERLPTLPRRNRPSRPDVVVSHRNVGSLRQQQVDGPYY